MHALLLLCYHSYTLIMVDFWVVGLHQRRWLVVIEPGKDIIADGCVLCLHTVRT
jgi:hypothetical protein